MQVEVSCEAFCEDFPFGDISSLHHVFFGEMTGKDNDFNDGIQNTLKAYYTLVIWWEMASNDAVVFWNDIIN